MRIGDDALLASVYLRTNGDPVGASRQCYRSILEQVAARDRSRRSDGIRTGGLRFRPPDRRPACHDRRGDQRNHRPRHRRGLFRSRGRHHFRNRRAGRQIHLYHQRRALRLRHERGLLGRHRLLSGRIGPGNPRGEDGRYRRHRPARGAAAQLQRPVRRLYRLGHQKRHSRRGRATRTSWPAWSTPSA